MKALIVLAVLTLSTATHAQQLPDIDYAAAKTYIVECDTDWAESAVTGDFSRRKIYFAEDFQGTGVDGQRYDKAAVTKERGPSATLVSNTINQIEVRFFGTTAIAYGDEKWVKKDETKGRFVWTDIWLYRNGQWQIVAAQDVKVLEE